jgi:16S rRNA (uracil1498-N3)-methyltransferase
LLHTAGGVPLQQLARQDAASPMVIVTGPEGGLAPDEVELLSSNGFVPGALGSRILRAETAPVIAVALLRANAL